MVTIRYVEISDKSFWYRLDRHLPESEFENKVAAKSGYILSADGKPAGLLRYNLFWDNTPFCTLLYVDQEYQGKGYGTLLLDFWEKEMKQKGYQMLLTSTQVDETAQHFYRKAGYKDCGCLLIDLPACAQPMEMFLIKAIP